MTATTSCTIRLLNKTHTVKCPEQEKENLQLAAQKLHAQMETIQNKFKNIDEAQTLLLAALHISHELISSQVEDAKRRQQLSHLIGSLESKINQTAIEREQAEIT